MPSEASEGCRGGAARGGAAPPARQQHLRSGFSQLLQKDPLRRGRQSAAAQPLAHPAKRRGRAGRGWGGASASPAPSGILMGGAPAELSAAAELLPRFRQLMHLLRSAVFRVRQPQY